MENQNVVDILLIEDRPEDAELAMMALRKHNFTNEIIWIKDGEEALEYVLAEGRYKDRNIESRPKLILLDLKMPKVDGIEVLRRIRSDARVKNIPVVVLTTSKEEEDVVRAYELHANAYMIKPVEFHAFVEAMKAIGMFWVLLNQTPR